jgi:hypothetical protein
MDAGVPRRDHRLALQAQPMRVLERAGLTSRPGKLQFASSMQEAAQQARAVLTPTSETLAVQQTDAGPTAGTAPTTRRAGP